MQTSGADLKALVFNIKRCSFEDGPGIRTTVFLKGCPLRCVWCCNPEGQERYPELQDGSVTKEFFERYMSVDEVMAIFKADLPFFEASGGGVTIAGGEPTMHYEFVHELLQRCRSDNIHTALDTCGCSQGKSAELLVEADLLLYDIKLLLEDEHIRFTSITNRPILENLQRVARIGKSVIVRIPIVPGYTDSDENILGIGELLCGLEAIQRVDLIAFHRFALTKYAVLNKKQILDSIALPSKAEMLRIKSMLEGFGLKVQIGG
ncbi:MAG: glycyl-radical enzyme activating protein [Thermodesulfobacteriota bacterium]|jgi:pyruvate formate lyase activating enzyme